MYFRWYCPVNISNSSNRLINEKSPYLEQRAHNPVYWFPWGEEAFEKAKREDKPVFLSIGYSTCHWCHVFIMLLDLVDKIVVHEGEGFGKTRKQKIEVYFRFVGAGIQFTEKIVS